MEANLRDDFLSLINLSSAHVYCSTTLSNHGLIRLKRSVSQISRKLCNQFYNQSIFNTPYMYLNIRCDRNFKSHCSNKTGLQFDAFVPDGRCLPCYTGILSNRQTVRRQDCGKSDALHKLFFFFSSRLASGLVLNLCLNFA